MERRKFIKSAYSVALLCNIIPSFAFSKVESDFTVTQITGGNFQHWFGYYDKWQIDPSGRFALAMQVERFFRSPKPSDRIKIGLIVLENGNSWQTIGTSSAWGWQQGCMLQWIPGSSDEVIWNDRNGDQFISKIYNIKTKEERQLPKPIYTLANDGSFGLGIDFARLSYYRPGYGYPLQKERNFNLKSPDDSGIYRIDLETGESNLILSYDKVAHIERPLGTVSENYHWINHLLINPQNNRFIFLNRSRPFATVEEFEMAMGNKLEGDNKYITRAITADLTGNAIYPLNDSGEFSHFVWKGNDAICAWAKPEDKENAGFHIFSDQSKYYKPVGKEEMTRNGHNTYVPNTNYEWILNDTYPTGKERLQELYLYHVPSQKKVVLGKFHEPEKFSGEWRCDLHPRCDQKGHNVYFDSTHNGGKRQIYRINIEKIILK